MVRRRFFALIPARGGSKGIKDKNLQIVGQETLLSRAITGGMGVSMIDEVWVSTDSVKILEASMGLGVRVHRRHPNAATDQSLAKDVVFDFIQARNLRDEDVVVYLQPTSPFRSSLSIEKALELFINRAFIPVIGVRRATQYPEKMLHVDDNGVTSLPDHLKANPTANRQQLLEYWYPNGAIYIFTARDFRALRDIPVASCTAFQMSEYESMDVDTPFELELCQKVSDSIDSRNRG